MICYFDFSVFTPFSNLFMKELQRTKNSIDNEEFIIKSDKVVWTNPQIGKTYKGIKSLSFIEKGSHSFKESYGLKEFLSRIERQSTVLDVLLVQVKAIVSILTKYDSIKGMEESTDQILEYDSDLNSNIKDIIKLFDKESDEKTISLRKIDRTLMETIEDAKGIIWLWKESPLSPFFNAVWDQLVHAWIYIDIFGTEYSYKLGEQHKGSTNKVFERLFEILTKKDFHIHQSKCIKDWNLVQKHLAYSETESESSSDEDRKRRRTRSKRKNRNYEESDSESDSESDIKRKNRNNKKSFEEEKREIEEDCLNIDCK